MGSGQTGMTGAPPVLLLCCPTSVNTAASLRAQFSVSAVQEALGKVPRITRTTRQYHHARPHLLHVGHGGRETPTLNTCSDDFFK